MCMTTAENVVCPHLANLDIIDQPGIHPRVLREARFTLNRQHCYDVFKTTDRGSAVEGGIELVKMRGILSQTKNRRTSSQTKKRTAEVFGQSVLARMPKMGKLV